MIDTKMNDLDLLLREVVSRSCHSLSTIAWHSTL